MAHFFGQTLKLASTVGLSVFIFSDTARAADCDRSCMKGLITQNRTALVAHDSSILPLASNVRFTEDAKDLKLGEGLWKNRITATSRFKPNMLEKPLAGMSTPLLAGKRMDCEAMIRTAITFEALKVLGNEIHAVHAFFPHDAEGNPSAAGNRV